MKLSDALGIQANDIRPPHMGEKILVTIPAGRKLVDPVVGEIVLGQDVQTTRSVGYCVLFRYNAVAGLYCFLCTVGESEDALAWLVMAPQSNLDECTWEAVDGPSPEGPA